MSTLAGGSGGYVNHLRWIPVRSGLSSLCLVWLHVQKMNGINRIPHATCEYACSGNHKLRICPNKGDTCIYL